MINPDLRDRPLASADIAEDDGCLFDKSGGSLQDASAINLSDRDHLAGGVRSGWAELMAAHVNALESARWNECHAEWQIMFEKPT
jgi:hypothetical protein